MQICLIRHPPPLVAAGVCYGQLDVDCRDAATYADRLRSLLPPCAPVYASPLRRALTLARALTPDVRVDARLAEIDFGQWEGQRWNDIPRPEIDAWAADVLGYAPPGGESVATLQARVLDFAASLVDPAAVLVTHAGVMRVLLGHWRRLPLTDCLHLEFAFGELVQLETSA